MIFTQTPADELRLSRAIVRLWRSNEQNVPDALARHARAVCNAELDPDDRVDLERVFVSERRQVHARALEAIGGPSHASWSHLLARFVLNNARLFRKREVELAQSVLEATP